MSSRIQSLLDIFHFQDRYYTEENKKYLEENWQMDYPDLSDVFLRERKRSHDYLKSSLHIKEC